MGGGAEAGESAVERPRRPAADEASALDWTAALEGSSWSRPIQTPRG